ncbi:hypothetical protein Pelo_17332 [Pelomyxa schiedti]|nr:hypothetical protein Pelo_17332 [Pelomyxa schiedti]
MSQLTNNVKMVQKVNSIEKLWVPATYIAIDDDLWGWAIKVKNNKKADKCGILSLGRWLIKKEVDCTVEVTTHNTADLSLMQQFNEVAEGDDDVNNWSTPSSGAISSYGSLSFNSIGGIACAVSACSALLILSSSTVTGHATATSCPALTTSVADPLLSRPTVATHRSS